MTVPIIHIGYSKTATTWFQQHFYPALSSHVFIPQRQSIEAVAQAYALPGGEDGDGAQMMRDCLAGDGMRPAIVCDETLLGSPRQVGLGGSHAMSVARLLHRLRPDAHIVIFVRAQPSMIASAYGEYLRGGGKRGFAAYLEPDLHQPDPGLHRLVYPRARLEHFEYDRVVACYDSLFGARQVHVFAYEAFLREPQAVIAAMARDLGFAPADGISFSMQPNSAYGRRLFPLVRLANRFCRGRILDEAVLIELPGWFRCSRNVLRLLNRPALAGKPPTPSELMGSGLMEKVVARYGDSNRRLAALRPGLALAELGYPMAPAAP